MNNARSPAKGYAVAVLLGAVGGGLLVAAVTRAIPNMVSRIMSTMKQKMLQHMRQSGLNPAEM